jgi:hypothetical protein
MSGPPGEEYRVRARIEGRSRRGRWVALLVAAIVVAGWIGITANAPRTATTPRGTTGQPSGPDLGADATLPPVVELVQPAEPMGRIPVLIGGLGWLDPARGTVERAALPDGAQWLFALADGGTACLCFDVATDTGGADLHLDRFDRAGTLTFAESVPGWLPPGDVPVLEDAILEPDGSGVIAAAAVPASGVWHLRVLDLPFGESSQGATSESDLDLAALGDPLRLQLRIAVSPDGARLRISVRQLASAPAEQPSLGLAWIARRESGTWGPPQPFRQSDQPGLVVCAAAAWATATDYVSICQAATANERGQLPTFVEIDRGDGRFELKDVGESAFQEATGWLVDGTHGVVYGWAAMSHQLYRIDVPTGQLTRRSFFRSDGPPGSLRGAGAEATAPPAGVAPVLWQPVGSAAQPFAGPLVGSPDGTLLYAMGLEFPSGTVGFGGPSSSGIWVFDAASLAIVAHWQPAITYESIGLAAGGHLLVGVGSASAEEQSVFGNHGPELAVHLTSDGSLIAIDRQLILQLGGMPFLLPAGPGP